MNGEKCIKCKKAMGNSLNAITGMDSIRHPIHYHCWKDECPTSTEDVIKKYIKG